MRANSCEISDGTTIGSRNSARLSNGLRPAPPRRCCQKTKAAVPATLAASDANVHHGHWSSRPTVSGRMSSNIVSPSRPTPIRSSFGRGAVVASSCGMTRSARTSSSTPIGTLIRNSGRQASPKTFAVMSTPPRIWPITALSESVIVYAPIARVRAFPVSVR